MLLTTHYKTSPDSSHNKDTLLLYYLSPFYIYDIFLFLPY